MCCLFGFHDYGHRLSRKQRSAILSILSTECGERGTDATGIAYNTGGKMRIYKRPIPAHLMWYRVPLESTVVMGHTRMTTQGSEKKNENNHPFLGSVADGKFALAHNGVLYNDHFLRKQEKLPATRIETDSFVAVQLVEQLTAREVEFVSKKEAIDTTTPSGKFMRTIFGAVAELEREGITIAKANSIYTGRKPVERQEFEATVLLWRAGHF